MRWFTLILLVFSVTLNAKGPLEMEFIETKTQDNAILKGFHWINEGKPKILLVHGFTENFRLYNDLALELHSKGYDVYAFNFRGHGNDENRSLVAGQNPDTETKVGTYGFDRVVSQDMPAMIDFVYDGKPILAVGHSLGGAALRMFLSGPQNRKYLPRIKSLVNIASPTSFQKSDLRFKLWTKLPGSMTNLGLNPLMRKYLGEYIFSGLYTKKNIQDPDRLFEEGFSLIPIDIVRDIRRWSESVFSSRKNVQYEGMPLPKSLKFYQIVGDKDNLVPPEEILREHKEYNITENPQVITLKSFGHIDLVFDQLSAKTITPLIQSVTCQSLF